MAISIRWIWQRSASPTTSTYAFQCYVRTLSTDRHTNSHFSHPTIKPSNIIVDAVSMSLLKGSVIDFATELIGSSFRIAENPQVSKTCVGVSSYAANFGISQRAMAVVVALAGSSRYDIYYPTS